MRNWRLILLLSGEAGVLIALANVGDLRRHVPLFWLLFAAAALLHLLAARSAVRRRLPFAAVLVIAIQLRIPMFFTQPTLSDDVWRYIHDGRAQQAGVNPYQYAPDDPRTAQFRGPEHGSINHPQLPTIYPPVAQYAFRLAAAFPAPLLAWRLLLLVAELALMLAGAALLARRRSAPANLALYAWHPLAIIEGIGSAHLEPIGIALLVLAVLAVAGAAPARAGIALAASAAAKLVAAPLILFTPRSTRLAIAFAATLLVVYLPFLFGDANVFGSLGTFAGRWESNGSIHPWLAPMIGARPYRLLSAVVVLVLLLVLKLKRMEFSDAALVYFLAIFALSPVVHPWYLLWPLAFVPLRAEPFDLLGSAVLVWSVTVVLSYAAHQQQLTNGVWSIPRTMLLAEYLPLYALLIYGAARKARRLAAPAVARS